VQPAPVNTNIDSNLGQGLFSLPWVTYFSQLTNYLASIPPSGQPLPNYVNDAAAAAGGVKLYGYYRNGSVVMQRIT
jgi:hypothetical protein